MYPYLEDFDKALPVVVKDYGKEFDALLDKWNNETPYFKRIMFEDARVKYDELYESIPNEVHLYRMVGAVDETFIKDKGTGLHWAYDTEGMANADRNCDISDVFPYIQVTEGTTDRDNIDWDAVFLYILDGYEDEHELRVKDPSKVEVTNRESYTAEEFRDKYWH